MLRRESRGDSARDAASCPSINGVEPVFLFDGWKPIAEWYAAKPDYFQAWNVYGPAADEILLRQQGDIGYVRFHPDRRGNVAFLVYNNGQVLEKCSYDAFGKATVRDASGGRPRSYSYYAHGFLFQGREYIRELGIYDYRNRFYHPETGRFLQTDSTGFDAGDMNLFRYCHDDPVDGSDPMGLTDIEISAEEIRLGVQAALNARANLIKYPERGPGRTQFVVPGPNGHPMLEKQFSTGEERVPVYRQKRGSNTSEKAGEFVTERGPKSRIESGHVHDDAGITGKKADREYTTYDRKEANGSAATKDKPAQSGHPVFKSYSSDGSKVDYLVPQTEPGQRASPHTISTNGSTGQSNLTANSVDVGPDPGAFMSLADGYDASFQRFSK